MKIVFKKTDIISYVLENHPNAEEILLSFGMHCIYCPVSQMESLEEACEVHGIEVEALLNALNENSTKSEKKTK